MIARFEGTRPDDYWMCWYAHDHPPRLAVQLDQKVHVQLGACHGDQREQRHVPGRRPPDPAVFPPIHRASQHQFTGDGIYVRTRRLGPRTRPPPLEPGGQVVRPQQEVWKLPIPYLPGSRMGAARHRQTRPDAMIAPASLPLSCRNNHMHHVRMPACSVCKQGVRGSSPLSCTRQTLRQEHLNGGRVVV